MAAAAEVLDHAPAWDLRSQTFAGALLDPDIDIPVGVGKNNAAAPKRFSVYRNNVVVSLMEALESVYPSCRALLGEENFNLFARAFVAKHPPTSPMMQHYGAGFAEFLERIPALSESPFLSDLARLERLWLDAYHAADAPVLTPDQLAGFSPEETLEIRLVTHPACFLLKSEHPVFDFFDARNAVPEGDIDLGTGQNVLVTRPEITVMLAHLSPAQTKFFEAMVGGESLGSAIGAAMGVADDFNPSETIALALETGAFSGLS